MIVGVVKEIKSQEYRVGLVPSGVRVVVEAGSKVIVQSNAGEGSGVSDSDFKNAGAEIIPTAKEVWKKSDLIIKVKEPLSSEFDLLQEKQSIYTYLHLAVCPDLAEVMLEKKITSIAYETIQLSSGALPLLKPMSEVAGKMSVQVGATYLQREHGGRGVLLGGVPGVRRGRVAILGAGTVGTNACKIAVGLGAEVTILDVNVDRLEYLDDIFGSKITTLKANSHNIEEAVTEADLLVGAVLIPGAKAPTLVNRKMVSQMNAGSVIVDVAVDQGGCVETCKPTTHDQPIYQIDGVIHYCVANIPGAVAYSSTYALTNATSYYLKKMVELGIKKSIEEDEALAFGVNTCGGAVTHAAVAEALHKQYKPLHEVL